MERAPLRSVRAASSPSIRASRTQLHTAAEAGDVAAIEAQLKDGTKVDVTDVVGYTPLHLACIGGHTAAVEVLLKAGANHRLRVLKGREDRRRAALQLAERRGKTAVVELLRQAEASTTALVDAAARGDLPAVKELLAKGVPVDAAPLESKNSWSALLWAAENGHEAVVDALLEAGADPAATGDRRQSTPLHRAALKGHATVVESLLRAGAPVDAVESPGYTPLHRAAFKGRVKAIHALLAGGADAALPVTSMDAYNGCTAAQLAEQRNHVSAAKLLWEAQGGSGEEKGSVEAADDKMEP